MARNLKHKEGDEFSYILTLLTQSMLYYELVTCIVLCTNGNNAYNPRTLWEETVADDQMREAVAKNLTPCHPGYCEQACCSQSGSWGYRCMGAGLRLNLGHAWGPQT